MRVEGDHRSDSAKTGYRGGGDDFRWQIYAGGIGVPGGVRECAGGAGDVGEVMAGKKGVGFFGWLGRQVGYVKKAVRADVTQRIVHREEKVEEAKLPQDPNVTLRRTVIDEVIVKKKGTKAQRHEG